MMKEKVVLLALLSIVSWVFLLGEGYGADPKTLKLGETVFKRRCAFCHGQKGDGKGMAEFVYKKAKGKVWKLYPRDFTNGVFRFRSTPTGSLPTDEDLLRIIENGIPRSSMPPAKDLSNDEKKAVIAYVKTLSPRWKEEGTGTAIMTKKPEWVGSVKSVEKGEQIYKDMKCWECHGEKGRGDGPKSDTIVDDWKKPILPFDFTVGKLKRGNNLEDIYLAYTTGLDGTGMPSYEDSLNDEDRWHLVSFTMKLMKKIQ
jgi:cytochrome c oxidase cbb3-type subunit 2